MLLLAHVPFHKQSLLDVYTPKILLFVTSCDYLCKYVFATVEGNMRYRVCSLLRAIDVNV